MHILASCDKYFAHSIGNKLKYFLLIGGSALLPSVALADNLSSPPPYRENITGPGSVNVITGALIFSSEDIQAGIPGSSDYLEFSRSYNSQAGSTPLAAFGEKFSHNFMMHLQWGTCVQVPDPLNCRIEVSAFGESYSFASYNGYSLANDQKNGAFLELISQSPATFRLTTKSGLVAIFENSNQYYSGSVEYNADVFVKYVQFPDGSFWTFNYQSAGSITFQPFPARIVNRLESVINSMGYGLSFSYINPGTGGYADKQKRIISSVRAFHSSCSVTCTRIYDGSASYAYSIPANSFDGFAQPIYYLTNVTFPDSYSVSYSHSQVWGSITSIKNTSNPYNNAEYGYANVFFEDWFTGDYLVASTIVSSFKDARGNVTEFNYDIDNKYMTITLPGGSYYQYHAVYDPRNPAGPGNQPVPDWIRDPLGRVTLYSYDNLARLLSVTYPEGNRESQILDDRENAVEVRKSAKPNSNLSDIVQTFHFPACGSSNYRFCNKPDYSVDGRGNRTDFLYDTASGGAFR